MNRIVILGLTAVLLLLGLPRTKANNAREVIRPNWGAHFARVGGLNNGQSEWVHTFAVPWVRADYEPIPDLVCRTASNSRQKEFCKSFASLIEDLNNQRRQVILDINKNIDVIKSMIPAKVASTRNKRGLFDFVGKIAQSLFGIARDGDVSTISAHVEAIEKLNNATSTRVTQMGRQLSSFINATNTRMSNAMAGIQQNHKLYIQLAEAVQKANVNLEDTHYFWVSLTMFLRTEIMATGTFHAVERETRGWLEGAQTLLEGYLPMQLVTPDQLSACLNDIEIRLTQAYPLFRLAHKDIGYYYQNRDVLFTQSEKYLYISVKIPVTSTSSYFDLYSVVTLPVPLNSTTSNTTKIVGLPAYFGVSRDSEFYTEISRDMYSSCHGTDVKTCSGVMSMKSRRFPSCVSALYFDQSNEILERCDIRYETSALFEGAIDLGENFYLASGSGSNWNQICANSPPTPIRGCAFCLIELPCGCGIDTDHFKIPPKISGCQSSSGKRLPTYLHPVNLPVLRKLFPSEQYAHVSGAQSFQQESVIHLPDLKVVNHEWSKVASNDEKFKLSFNKIAQNVKTSDYLYKSQADFIKAETAKNPNQRASWLSSDEVRLSVTIVPSIISVISLILSIYIFISTRRTLAFIPLAQNLPTAKAWLQVSNDSITAYHHRPVVTSFMSNNQSSTVKDLMVDTVIILVIVLIVANFLLNITRLIYVKLLRKRVHGSIGCNSQLWLELSDNHHCVTLKILKVPACPSNLTTDRLLPPSSLIFKDGFMTGQVSLDWTVPQIMRKTDGRTYQLPDKIKIMGMTKRRLRAILAHPYVAHLTIAHGSIAMPLTYRALPVDAQSIVAPTGNTQSDDNRPNLYPKLQSI